MSRLVDSQCSVAAEGSRFGVDRKLSQSLPLSLVRREIAANEASQEAFYMNFQRVFFEGG
jgi:hypothetical protein